MKLINIGFGNLISEERLVAVISPDSAPVKRMIQETRERGMLIDASFGRKTQSVLVMDSGNVVMDGPPREILVRTEELHAIGLAAPHTVELLHGLREDGFDVPLDALGIQECAEAIARAL